MSRYVIALDQGTTSSRAMLVDRQARGLLRAEPLPAALPASGLGGARPARHPVLPAGALTELVVSNGLTQADVACIGITNQRETTVVWRRDTGEPVCNAIVWQCRRTADLVERLCGNPEVAAEVTALMVGA